MASACYARNRSAIDLFHPYRPLHFYNAFQCIRWMLLPLSVPSQNLTMNRHTAAIIKRGSRTLTTSRILANTAATLPSQEAETSTQAQQRAESAAVKARAWYLDDAEPSSPSESPRRPVFTTFNALDTLPEPAANTPLQPFPADAPVFAHPLYDFLTTNELFVPHSISFNKTSTSSAARSVADLGDGSSPERGRRRRGKVDSGEGIVIPGHEVGAFWDWVVIAQVAARGKGAVRPHRSWCHT